MQKHKHQSMHMLTHMLVYTHTHIHSSTHAGIQILSPHLHERNRTQGEANEDPLTAQCRYLPAGKRDNTAVVPIIYPGEARLGCCKGESGLGVQVCKGHGDLLRRGTEMKGMWALEYRCEGTWWAGAREQGTGRTWVQAMGTGGSSQTKGVGSWIELNDKAS